VLLPQGHACRRTGHALQNDWVWQVLLSRHENVEWPVVGVALQKNYISVYFAVTKRGAAVTDPYAGRLGELRMGRNNFSCERFDDLDSSTAAALFSEAAQIFEADPEK
jgi:hypothetical protein